MNRRYGWVIAAVCMVTSTAAWCAPAAAQDPQRRQQDRSRLHLIRLLSQGTGSSAILSAIWL